MLEVEIIEKEFGPALEIESKCKMFGMPKEMGSSFTQLSDYIKGKHVKCSSAPYARYVDIDWEEQMKGGFFLGLKMMFSKIWHFYSGYPVEKSIEPTDNMHYKSHPPKRYITATHFGPYQNVGKTYTAMYKWAKDKGFKCAPESFEFYMNDPYKVQKVDLETVCYIPVEE